MAIRLERRDGLTYIRGAPEDPEMPKRRSRNLGLWLALIVLVTGALFVPSNALSWTAVSHAFRAILAAVH